MGGQLVLFHIYLKTFIIKMINNNTIISDFLSANLGYVMFFKVPGELTELMLLRIEQ